MHKLIVEALISAAETHNRMKINTAGEQILEQIEIKYRANKDDLESQLNNAKFIYFGLNRPKDTPAYKIATQILEDLKLELQEGTTNE